MLLRHSNGDRIACTTSIYVRPAFDFRFGPALQLQAIVIDKGLRHLDEGYIACDTSVVPPICLECGNAILEPRTIHGDNREVAAVVNDVRDFAIKGSEAAFVLASFLPVHPDIRAIVSRSHMKEEACPGHRSIIEVLLVPDWTFVEKQRLTLSVPIARYAQRRRLCKVVFDKPPATALLFVFEVAVGSQLAMEAV